jgi:hypothetical protein
VGGASNGAAFGLNNLGQVVGFAENGIVGDSTDPTDCSAGGTPFQRFQFEAVLWEPNGQIRELSPLEGDTVGYAFGNNDLAQVVGILGDVLEYRPSTSQPRWAARLAMGGGWFAH